MNGLVQRADLAFPLDEYAGRLTGAAQALTAAGFDALVATSPENICYFSGFDSVGYFNPQALVLAGDGRANLITRALEIPNAEASCALSRLVGLRDHETLVEKVASELVSFGVGRGRVGA